MNRLLLFALYLLPAGAAAQDLPITITAEEIDALPTITLPHETVVLGYAGDGFPDSLTVSGVIEDATPAAAGCGVMCWGGTVAVRLDDPTLTESGLAFVVVPCMTGPEPERYIGQRVRFTAFKLTEDHCECYYRSVFNRLDSHGAPFYAVGEEVWPAFE